MYKLYYLTSEKDNYIPRYIGYTSLSLEKRLKEHLNESIYNKNKSHKVNWVKNLLKSNIDIKIVSYGVVTNDIKNILLLEREYIEKYDKLYNLTNSTNGGEESKTFKEHIRKKISKSLKDYYKINPPWNKDKNIPNKTKGIKRPNILGDKNPFYNKCHTDSTKKKIGDTNRKHRCFTYDEIYNYYITMNLSQKKISEILKLNRPYICRLIKKYDLVTIKKQIYGRIK
ncbi:MAG: hypothetical protein ACLFPJ_06270 [Candidatus Woesearchaeota archaeon]